MEGQAQEAQEDGEVNALAEQPAPKPTFTHRWRLKRVLPQQFGKLCRIVPQDYSSRPGWKAGHAQHWGMITVEFQDGTQVSAHRAALRPIGFSGSTGRRGEPGRCSRCDGGHDTAHHPRSKPV